jgi:hypothetical protein
MDRRTFLAGVAAGALSAGGAAAQHGGNEPVASLPKAPPSPEPFASQFPLFRAVQGEPAVLEGSTDGQGGTERGIRGTGTRAGTVSVPPCSTCPFPFRQEIPLVVPPVPPVPLERGRPAIEIENFS